MRIELNCGGLSGHGSVSTIRSDLTSMIGKSSLMISALEAVKKFTYGANGGVGSLQNALDQVVNKINAEKAKKERMEEALKKYNAFIELAKQTDEKVAELVTKNKDEFYKVNPWAAPSIGINISAIFWASQWAIRIMQWLTGVNPGVVIMGGGSAVALGLGLLKNISGEGNGDITDLFSLTGKAEGHGPTGQKTATGVEGSLLSGEAIVTGKIAGFDANAKAEGELIGGSLGYEMGGEWDMEEGEMKAGISGKAEDHLAKGSVSGSIGYLNGKAEGSVGNVEAKGEAGISIMSDGKFAPGAKAEVEASANVAKGSVDQSFGTDDFDIHTHAEGEVLTAKANAGVKAGVITYTDEATGTTKTKIGAEASAGAEAYVAQGEVKGGLNIGGLKINVGISGKAGGAGVKVGGGVSNEGVSGEIGAGLGLGVGLKLDVDWSEFKPEKLLPWNWF